jgi:hypothetical protein
LFLEVFNSDILFEIVKDDLGVNHFLEKLLMMAATLQGIPSRDKIRHLLENSTSSV